MPRINTTISRVSGANAYLTSRHERFDARLDVTEERSRGEASDQQRGDRRIIGNRRLNPGSAPGGDVLAWLTHEDRAIRAQHINRAK